MINELLQRFAPKAETKAPESSPPETCARCGGTHYWQPKHSQAWHCWSCESPPVLSLVGKESGVEKNTVKEITHRHYTVNANFPCSECRGKIQVETTWSDGELQCKCWTCGAAKV